MFASRQLSRQNGKGSPQKSSTTAVISLPVVGSQTRICLFAYGPAPPIPGIVKLTILIVATSSCV